MSQEKVILVDQQDRALGEMEKIEAHQKGLLHRAFSIFLLNNKGELLLQKRSSKKYHSPSLWTNTCCSHPRPGEDLFDAANRRLKEEMGIIARLQNAYSFIYKADVGNGLIEHEFDHVLLGSYSDKPSFNKDEVGEYQYVSLAELENSISNSPDNFTEWFKITFPDFKQFINSKK